MRALVAALEALRVPCALSVVADSTLVRQLAGQLAKRKPSRGRAGPWVRALQLAYQHEITVRTPSEEQLTVLAQCEDIALRTVERRLRQSSAEGSSPGKRPARKRAKGPRAAKNPKVRRPAAADHALPEGVLLPIRSRRRRPGLQRIGELLVDLPRHSRP
jgi:hypothetical protein